MNINQIIKKATLSFYINFLREIEDYSKKPIEIQSKVLNNLVKCGRETFYGKKHHFEQINSYKDFQNNVPIVRYNDIVEYINRIRKGENYILWNQKVKWFAKSSGTSSDKSKFIPITPDSLYINHFGGMKRMIVNYAANNPKTKIFTTKALTLGGSVQADTISSTTKSYCGDLSAVMLYNSPFYAELIRTPKKSTALTAEFDKKVELICNESTKQDVSNFSGVPSWNLILLNKILEYTKKDNINEIWPNLELFMHGGTSFNQYRELYKKIIPSDGMHYIENYNASEGYFAFQNQEDHRDMLLTLNNGVFYEFVPFKNLEEAMSGNNSNVTNLEGVKPNIDYAIIISTCGGLWRYLIEDLVRFTSINPYKIIITGRTKMYINAFGEELMTDNAEKALLNASMKMGVNIVEFTVAPQFMEIEDGGGIKKGRHIWAIEFKNQEFQKGSPAYDQKKLEDFSILLDKELANINSDYEAKRKNDFTMQSLKIEPLKEGAFLKWMKSRGKVGGQNKVPRLWQDMTYIEQLIDINRSL